MNVKLLVEGGEMKPGPALSQKLGPAGININEVIQKVNDATKNFKGMKVPVEIEVDTKAKTFEVQIFSPPISELIKKEAGIQSGSGIQGKKKVANLSIEQIIKIADTKMPNLLCNDLKAAVKTTVGSCGSLGILVESKSIQEVEMEIDAGKYDKEIKNKITETPSEKKNKMDAFFSDFKAKQEQKLKQEGTPETATDTKKKK